MSYLKIVALVIFLTLISFSSKASVKYHVGEPIKFSFQDIKCLADNIYFEARDQSVDAEFAIAQVVINRVKTGVWGNTVCSVVYARSQFSWVSNHHLVLNDKISWFKAIRISMMVLYNNIRVTNLESLNSLYYCATYVHPYWSKKMKLIEIIGKTKFY